MTEAEYFAQDAAYEEGRLEYLAGRLIRLEPASLTHADVVANTGAYLHYQLRGTDARPMMSRQRVAIPARETFLYPDVLVVQGERRYQPGVQPAALLNPVLIVEVLSAATEAYDRGPKFEAYQRIGSLRYYVLLDSQRVSAYLYSREPGADLWTLRYYDELRATLPLTALGVDLPLAEAYAAVVFGEGEEPRL